MNTWANQSAEPTGGSGCAQTAFASPWRPHPVAHAWCWPHYPELNGNFMKLIFKQFATIAFVAASVLLGVQDVSGLGSDFFTNKISSMPGYVEYPKGFEELVNATNRIAGFGVNSESVFFFAGKAQDFTTFLEAYAKIPVAGEHQLIIHDGVGQAKSPWAKTGRPCDWELYACPKGWLDAHDLIRQGTNSLAAVQTAAKDTNYVMVVHFWTGGRVALDQVQTPPNVQAKKGE